VCAFRRSNELDNYKKRRGCKENREAKAHDPLPPLGVGRRS
jgi:hypothetical protein